MVGEGEWVGDAKSQRHGGRRANLPHTSRARAGQSRFFRTLRSGIERGVRRVLKWSGIVPWRCVRQVSFWSLVGVLATVLVCWSIAAFLPQRGWSEWVFWESDRYGWQKSLDVYEFRSVGAVRRGWEVDVPGEDRFPIFEFAIADAVDRGIWEQAANRRYSWLPWGGLEAVRPDPVKSPMGCEHATGWPVPALWYAIVLERLPDQTLGARAEGGIPFEPSLVRARRGMAEIRALPYRPIWPGIAVDTAAYGLIGWLVFGGLRFLRAAWRRRRRCCPECGYSLEGIAAGVCPECGGSCP